MGGVLSRECIESRRSPACRRLKQLFAAGYWFSSNLLWILSTSAICLVAPVIFYYERECQMFEMQQQFMEAQQAAAAAQQMQQMAATAT